MKKSKNILTSRFGYFLLGFALFAMASNHFLHYIYNFSFFGNGWLTIPLVLLLFISIKELFSERKTVLEYITYSFVVLLFLISSTYQLNYSSDLVLVGSRDIITPILAFLLIDSLSKNNSNFKYYFFLIGFFALCLQMSSYTFFTNVQVISIQSASYIDLNGSFTRDGFLGSSFSAYLAAFCNYYAVKRFKGITLIFFMFFFLTLVLYADSRNGWVLLLISYLPFLQRLRFNEILLSLFGLLMIFTLFALPFFTEYTRFGSESLFDVRTTKYILGLSIWTENPLAFLFGADKEIIATTFSNGYLFSDNSFLQIALDYGLIGLVGYSMVLFLFFKKYGFDTVPLTMFLMGLLITNSCLWDYFIISSMAFMVNDND